MKNLDSQVKSPNLRFAFATFLVLIGVFYAYVAAGTSSMIQAFGWGVAFGGAIGLAFRFDPGNPDLRFAPSMQYVWAALAVGYFTAWLLLFSWTVSPLAQAIGFTLALRWSSGVRPVIPFWK